MGEGVFAREVEALEELGVLPSGYVVCSDELRTAYERLVAGVPFVVAGIQDAVVVGVGAAVGADIEEVEIGAAAVLFF